MNRPYVYRGRTVRGVHQRCTDQCGLRRCTRHRWRYTIELPPTPDGTRHQIVKGGFATGRDAATARTLALHTARPNADTPEQMTVGQWLPQWLATRYERGELREGTAAGYHDNIEHYLIP